MDIPRIRNVFKSAHRIHNPFTSEQLATLGAALRLEPGTRLLDLASGSGEMLNGLRAPGAMPCIRVNTWVGAYSHGWRGHKRMKLEFHNGL